MKKATFIESYRDRSFGQDMIIRVYSYRGRTYDTYENRNKGNIPLVWQHRSAQSEIDNQIEIEERLKNSTKCEDAQKGFDLFWEYVNGDGE